MVEPETADLTTAEDVPKVDRKGKGKMVEREFSPTAVDVQTLARKLCDASAKVKISLTAPTSTGTIAMVATLPVTPPAASSSAPVSRAESVKSAASSQRSLPSKLATAPALSYAQRLTSGTKTWDLSSRPEHQINNRRLANASADSAGADSFKSDSGSSNDSPKGGRRPGAKPGSSARVGLGTDMERTSSRSKGKLAKNTSGRSTLIAERMTTPAKIATGLPASGTSWAAKAASAPKLGATVQKTGPAAPPPNPVSAVSQNTSSFRPAFRPAAASTTASQLSSGDSWAARLKTPYKPTTTLGGQSLTGPAGEIGGRGASALGTPATADRSKLRGLSWRATESPQKVAPAQEAGAIAKGPGSGGRLAETGKGTAGPSHKGETEWQTVGGQKAKAKTQQISEKEVGNSSKKPITGDDTESVADCDKPIPSIETYQASEATGTGESGESGDVKTEVTAESVLQRSTFNWADEMDDEDF